MILYISSFILCLLFRYIKQTQSSVKFFCFYCCFLCLFLCFGYMCGSDWRGYEIMYNRIDLDNLFSDYYAEPGYYIYMLGFKYLKIDFWIFFIFTKVVVFFIIVKALIKYSDKEKYIAFMYFIPWYGFYLFIDNPMRNLIAISIFIFAVKYIVHQKLFIYCGLICLASLFHTSAIIFLPFYFIANKKIKNFWFVLLFVLFNVFFASKDFLVDFIDYIAGGIPYVSAKLNSYIVNESIYAEGRLLSFGMIFHILFFVVLLLKRRNIESYENGIIIFNSAIIYLLFYRLATTIEIFARFQLYLCVFFCAAIALLSSMFNLRSKIIYTLYLLLLAFVGSNRIYADFRYIPYSNYLEYVIKGYFPSYNERDNYNLKHSPCK